MNDKNESVTLEVSGTFKHEVIKEVLKSNFVNPKNKITDDAVALVAELTKLLVVETAMRSAKQAKQECRQMVLLDHVETILPQLMLDFP